MIDLHSHTIFNVDDGAKTLEESIDMIKSAQKAGFNKICFTPHYMEDGYKTQKDVLLQKIDILNLECKKQGIDMELYLGEEVFIFPDLANNLR